MLLAVEGVAKRFGGLQALQDISFDVPAGGTFGVMGANGAGKTTLFNVIAGAQHPDRGRVRLGGRDITALPPSARCLQGIGRTFQITRPFPDLTVRETVRIGALNRIRRMAAATARAEAIIDQFGLRAHADRLGRQLTVMDRKRLELARAYATGPTILLLDEVAAGLRPAEVDQLVALIGAITAEGVTVLMIEHVLPAIFALASRILVLDHGQAIASGTPGEISADRTVIDAYLGAGYAAA